MDLKVINQNENKLFKRKEAVFEIISHSAPSRENVTKAIAKKMSASEDAVKIMNIASGFGSNTFKIQANIYSSKQDKDLTELKKKKDIEREKKKADAEKAAREAEQKAKEEAAKPKEAPIEEVKEEKAE